MGGLIVDTSVFVRLERQGLSPDFARWSDYGDVAISVVTFSELLVGVHRADSAMRRSKRQSFIDLVRRHLTLVPFDEMIAVEHARLSAMLTLAGKPIGAHDQIIAATAMARGSAVLTANAREFSHVQGLQVLPF